MRLIIGLNGLYYSEINKKEYIGFAVNCSYKEIMSLCAQYAPDDIKKDQSHLCFFSPKQEDSWSQKVYIDNAHLEELWNKLKEKEVKQNV